jgi:hypothetical protein
MLDIAIVLENCGLHKSDVSDVSQRILETRYLYTLSLGPQTTHHITFSR